MRASGGWWVGMLVAVVMVLLVGCGGAARPVEPMAGGLAAGGALSGDPVAADAILRATVRVRLVAPYLDGQGQPVRVEQDGRLVGLSAITTGLGTLIDAGGRAYLLTHDHYAQLDTTVAEAIITDHTGREIALPIADFRAAIRYRNNGVLVLEAPPGLPAGVAPGDGERIAPGSAVRVVHRDPTTDTLSVVAAVVEGWIDYQGIPSFVLRNVAGEVIAPGNSGGGVWHDGRPVGSIHRTILAAEEGETAAPTPTSPSHRGYATRLGVGMVK